MAWVNKNFALSTLDGGVLIGATSIVVVTGANFPATGNFMCVIWDQAYANPSFDASRELVLCTARSTNTITVTRAQEGTSAKAWNSGDKVAHVYTAAMLDAIVYLTATQTLTNKTLTTPTIASMVNANHDHSAGAGGGVLPASSIGSGTLVHERGGLESDVSAANGLVKISGGATSIVAAPASTIVGISDTQELSNKTLTQAVWTNFTADTGWSTVQQPAYLKDSMGWYNLRGAIVGNGNTDPTIYNRIPEGPYQSWNMRMPKYAAQPDFVISVSTGGVISIDQGVSGTTTVYLDGIRFKAA